MINKRVAVNFIDEVFLDVFVFFGKSAIKKMIHFKFGEGAKSFSTLFEVWYIFGIEVHETKKGVNVADRVKSWPSI